MGHTFYLFAGLFAAYLLPLLVMIISKATYADGRTEGRVPCRVEFQRSGIRITMVASNGNSQVVIWEPAQLHPRIHAEKGLHKLTYGNFPYQTLELEGEQVISGLQQLYPELGLQENRQFAILPFNYPVLIGSLMLLFGVIYGTAVWALPWLKEKALSFIPPQTEIEMGQQLFEQTIQEYEQDSTASALVNQMMRYISDTTVYPIKIHVVKHPQLNAFALPGGHIIVYDSILKGMSSYEELLALLAHEQAHVTLRHSTRTLFTQLSTLALAQLVLGDVGSISGILLNQSLQLTQLHYSRELEIEADQQAREWLHQKKYHLNGMVALFNRLEAATTLVPELLSTHPAAEERRQQTEIFMETHPQKGWIINPDLDITFKQLHTYLQDHE